MKVEVHVLFFYETWLSNYIIRHYSQFAQRIVVHNAGPNKLIATPDWFSGACSTFEDVPWDCPEVNDLKYAELRNNCWKGTDADWVIVVDADEFIYFPEGAEKSLGAYTRMGAAVIRPHGFEMFSETLPTGGGQIYEEIKMGAPDDKWYAKPVLFNPKLVSDMRFGLGSHEANPHLHDGRSFHVGPKWPFAKPACNLLHYHQIGPADWIAERYDGNIKRMCKENKANHWGNLAPGHIHVQEKRSKILPNLFRVIP